MTSFVSALDRPTASPSSDVSRLRDCLAFLRHVDRVEIAGETYDGDGRRCLALRVGVKDDDVERSKPASDKAQLTIVRPSEPYEVQRTKKEFVELRSRMRQWASTHSAAAQANHAEPCAFCEAVERDYAEAGSEQAKKKGFFRSIFKKTDKEPEDWATWLNASIVHASAIDADTCELCDGVQHVPALLARFLLDGYLSDVIM